MSGKPGPPLQPLHADESLIDSKLEKNRELSNQQQSFRVGRHGNLMRAELYWIPGTGLGRLAILPRPRGGDWLEDEVRSWRQAGVDAAVSLLTREEIDDLDLANESDWCRANGIELVSFLIADREIPASREAAVRLVMRLAGLLGTGKSIAIHCRQGIGRAGLMAACLLVALGDDAETAMQRVSAARGCPIPETAE